MSMMLAMMSTVFGSVYPHDFDQFMQRCGASDVKVWRVCYWIALAVPPVQLIWHRERLHDAFQESGSGVAARPAEEGYRALPRNSW